SVYFAANAGAASGNTNQLWESDGSAAGTQVVDPALTGSIYANLTNVSGGLYFTDNGVLYKTDGSAAGTIQLGSSSASSLQVVNGTLFFSGADSTHGQELWTSNGTTAGTV